MYFLRFRFWCTLDVSLCYTALPHTHITQRVAQVVASRRLSTSDMSSSTSASSGSESDDLTGHVTKITPGNQDTDIPLDAKITVFFDRDVRTVNINKLFEVCGVCVLTGIVCVPYIEN